MGLPLEFTIQGEKQMSVELGIAADHLSDFSQPMRKTSVIMMNAVQENYDGRGSRFGKWKPRKPTNPPQTHPLLEKSGKMRRSMYKESGQNHALVSNKDTKKFRVHQSNEPRSKIPRRVMLAMDDRMNTDIVKVFQAYIVKSLRGRR